MRLSDVLKQAGVSRTAYYSLVRKDSVLPKSILRIARHLGVNPSDLLENGEAKIQHLRDLQNQAAALAKRYPDCDREVMFRTLLNLEQPPIERLRRALIRARKPAIKSLTRHNRKQEEKFEQKHAKIAKAIAAITPQPHSFSEIKPMMVAPQAKPFRSPRSSRASVQISSAPTQNQDAIATGRRVLNANNRSKSAILTAES